MNRKFSFLPGFLPVALFFLLVLLAGHTVLAATNLSVWVYPGASGRLIYQPDALGNRILDYTIVGYSNGVVAIPNVTVKTNLSPVAGDNGPMIQAAINYVATLPLTNGFRGAVFLNAGTYAISNSITISTSGIVLRGAGDGTNGTILRAAGVRPTAAVAADHAPLIIISGSGSASTSGIARNITNNYVPVGARSFNVDNTNGLTVGSRVMITRASPTNWIHDIGMDLVSPAWTAGNFNVPSERFITRIEGSRIMLDAPLTCAIEKQYGGATIQTYAWSGRINNVGVEDIRGVSDFNPSVTTNTGAASYYFSDELHALDFIEADTVENGWVRRVTSQSFGYACVHLTAGSRNFTLRDCDSLDPVSIITGERRYAFSLADAQNCLVQNCYTRNDRHQFVTDSLNTGPNVFVDGVSDLAYNDCGPHFRWGTGAIWDNVTVNGASADGVLAVRNRGNLGTSHGWAGANEVVWNARAADSGGGFTVESPPTARNWLIGGIGKLVTNSAAIPNPAPAGTYDSRNTNVFPNSLYFAELQDRLAVPNLQPRDYWLGVIDAFTNNLPGGEKVFLDSTWSNAVNSAAGGQPLDGFNIVTNNHWIPFSFNFTLATNESVIAATLSLSMRAFNSANTNKLYLGATNNSLTFSNLGWLPIGTGTNTTVRVLDLVSQLNTLTNGQLNVAAQGDLGIDWAMLELQVAPTTSFATASLAPVADAAVRGGTNAAINFGTATTLTVRQDASTNNQQRAYLRWDLSGVSRPVLQARVVLTPVNVPANGIEQGVAIASSNNWTEAGITWNNQPAGGERFATWLPGTNTPVSFDVTPQVMDALTADKQLSVELFSIGTNSVDYASRENAPATNQPQLVLVINKAAASVTLTNLSQTYDGTAKNVTATTVPPGLTVNVTYNGSPSAPTNAGSYTVVGTINDINYSGSATNTLLVVSTTPPQFTNTVYSAGSGFTLSGTGPAGQPYRIFATTNLVLSFINWTAISTGSFGGGVFSFIDPQATSQVQRFYRIVTP